ncbi:MULTISPECIES: BRO family protein [unclassified Lysinibacillus]|uniref:BRO family protein n=1 Tax=unclassified Lysinibacillus TaxID=2636778 RepID=UPI0008853E09|nr:MULTISPECIES: BRO family protein [unclassified Lysinibacillus]SCY99341.1 Prophage antirepressor [Lysinibacillus sp. SG9]SDB46895.1 Prophage antirepressor [Lysinibacillus sp. TC-37]SFT12649.1 Prophage antirepressor [Lysinibacillus sp. SG55]
MQLQIIKSEMFNNVSCDFYQNQNNEVFMTINQLAQALEYADRSGVQKIVNRNEYLKEIEFSTEDNLSLVEGNRKVEREVRIFTEDGIYEVTMLSKQPKAREFRAFVRKTLKALRKGEMILMQPQSLDAELEIKRMRAEAMLNNSRTKQAKLILDMQKNKTLSTIAVELLQINALEVLGDKAIEHRPEVEKSYTATELGKKFGVSAQKIGKLANAHNLKTDEYGYFALDKSPYSNKQVESFRYFESGKEKIQELLGVS